MPQNTYKGHIRAFYNIETGASFPIIDNKKKKIFTYNTTWFQWQIYHRINHKWRIHCSVIIFPWRLPKNTRKINNQFMVYIFILLPLLLRLIPYGGDHEDRRTPNNEDNLFRYLYLLPWPYSAGTENIRRWIVQGPSKVPDETFYQLVLK